MDSPTPRSYETPRITTYGSLAELTAVHDVLGGVPLGNIEMSLSTVVPPGPPPGGVDLSPGPPPGGPPPGGPPPGGPPPGGVPPPGDVGTIEGSGSPDSQPEDETADRGETPGARDQLGSTETGGPDAPVGGGQQLGGGGGSLPFTGAEVSVVAAIGAALVAFGGAVRRVVTRN